MLVVVGRFVCWSGAVVWVGWVDGVCVVLLCGRWVTWGVVCVCVVVVEVVLVLGEGRKVCAPSRGAVGCPLVGGVCWCVSGFRNAIFLSWVLVS